MGTEILGALKDAMIQATNPNNNFGSHANLYVMDYLGEGGESFALLSFDISAIPSGAIVTSAPFTMYQASGDYLGHTHWIYKLLHSDWVEGQVTYNNKYNGETWISGAISAADMNADDAVSAIVPDYFLERWVEWDIVAMVQATIDASNTQLDIIVLGVISTTGLTYYVSSDGVAGTLPKLTINYSVPAVGSSQAHII